MNVFELSLKVIWPGCRELEYSYGQQQFSDIIFYNSPEGNVKVEVIFNDETFWLMKLAESECEKFRVSQDQAFISDFEKEVKRLNSN